MPFKDVPRVIYGKNPLIEVVCQLRFPRILSINELPPVDFQDRIRGDYPIFEVATEHQRQITIDTADDNIVAIPRITQSEKIKNYKFSSDDGIWHINLTSTFLALSTSTYTTWEDFKTRLREPLKALIEIYKPAFFERVGLRYIDAYRRSILGLENTPWNELINPFALGFLSSQDVMDEIKGYSCTTELDIGGGALAQINTALGYTGDPNSKIGAGTPELSFIVDGDMFFGKKRINDVEESLEILHGASSKLIRAIITEKLHEAMEPQSK